MSIPAKVLPFELRPSRAAPDVDITSLLEQCHQTALKHLELALQRVFDNVDDALFAMADKAESGMAQNAYFDAMRDIRLKRDRVRQDYTKSFSRLYEDTLAGTVRSGKDGFQSGSESSFSLVGEQEMEELVAVDGLVSKTRDRFRDVLFGLEQRYGTLLGRTEANHNDNPFDPRALCQAFRESMSTLEMDIKVKLLIYKLFDQYVMWNVGALYEEISNLLVKSGVLPQLKRGVYKTAGGALPRRPPPLSDAPAENAPATGMDGPMPVDTFERLQYLLGRHRAGYGFGMGAPRVEGDPTAWCGVDEVYSVDDMLEIFSRIQHEGSSGQSGEAYFSGREELMAALRNGAASDAKRLHPIHDNTIDVVGMLFDFLLDAPDLPESIKAQICRLQIPIIKIAVMDTEFFSRKQHPARRLLNELAYAGASWSDLDHGEQASLYDAVRRIVERVLCEFDRDAVVFEVALDDLFSLLAGVRNKGTRSAIEAAHNAAMTAILAAVGDRSVPAVIAQYLRDIWSRVLSHVALTEGAASEHWDVHCAIMERLLWTVEPKYSREDREKLIRLLPTLLDELRSGMGLIGCTCAEIDDAVAALEGCHLASIRGDGERESASLDTGDIELDIAAWINTMRQDLAGLTDSALEFDAVAGLSPGSAAEYPTLDEMVRASGGAVPALAQNDPEVQAIRAMPVGTWVEFMQDEKARRGKLAWKDDQHGEYLFVDRRYRVVADKALAELAAALKDGQARIIEDVAFLDRALDAVMNRLMGATLH